MDSSPRQPIAIVGVSALFPGSSDASGFWRDILAGRDLLVDVPATHWRIDDYYDADPSAPDKTYARRGGFLSPIDFDALGWGVPPSTLPATDTSQLLALVVAQAVLQDAAREQFEQMDRSRISVILGVTSAQELLFSLVSRLQRPVWVKALRESGLPEDQVQAACERIAANYVPWQEASFPGLLGNVVAGRIANRLNLGGTNCVTDAACASSFSALAMGVNELLLGDSDMVIAGGVDTLNDIFMYMCFSKTPALSPSGDCRPFSDQADGTMLGEGLGMVALKRLADAERDGDRIYAVVKGVGTSSDGRSKSVYAPVASGQARALQRAYALAGYEPQTVELMEGHGTGTKAGDAAEFEGLRTVFDAGAPSRRQWCALGSVKSQIGHTKAAAGAAGLFKTVMALQHKVLPPTIKVDAPNPKLDIADSPFYLNTEARPWIRGSDHPRRASVSAFGFGGSNFHLTLEEYTGPAPRAERLPMQPAELVLLQADSADALQARVREMLDDTRPLAMLAASSRQDWNAASTCRLALVASDRDVLQKRLRAALDRIGAAPAESFSLPDGSSYGIGAADGKLAVLFPGQGSQYIGMGAALAMQFDAARKVWDSAADIALGEQALHEIVFPRPVFDETARAADLQRLTATEWAQPALAACSAAQWAVLRELGVSGDLFAGHSFGELMALHAAGAFDLPTALRLARRRGELMRDAADVPGAMLALSQTVERVYELLADHGPGLVIANHNAPTQVIVSGPLAAIDAFETRLQSQSIGCKRLPVATAFHSSVVAPAADGLAAALADVAIAAPMLPVYGNTTASTYPEDVATIARQLAAQLANPVRFVEMIEAMYADGARVFVEVGAGSVLSGLVAATLGEREHQVIAFDRKGRNGVETLLAGLARLAAAGVALQPARLFADTRLPALPVAGKLAVPICGSNVGKPYPPLDPAAIPRPNAVAVAATDTVADTVSKALDSRLRGNDGGLGLAAGAPSAPSGRRPREGGDPATHAHSGHATTSLDHRLPGNDDAAAVSTSIPLSDQVPSMPIDPSVSAAWLAAFQEHQQQTAAAQAAFQRALADSHAAYLGLAESALNGLTAMLGQPGAGSATSADTMQAMPASATATIAPRSAVAPVPTAPAAAMPPSVAAPVQSPSAGTGIARASQAQPAASVAAAVAAAIATPQPAAAPAAAIDLAALLLDIVADKTGYPVDMLNLDMDLEGDLGVDSIKRVEILAAVDERAPQLPKVDRARLGALHTLGEIVDFLQSAAGLTTVDHIASRSATAAPAIDPAHLAELLLAVVADKTGYPADMLNLDMDLEGDLGVDSIKRVEILAAVDERAPELPKVDRARLSALHTLREIVDFLQSASGQAVAAPPAIAATASAPATSAVIDRDALAALLIAVVADKTGYPADMLSLDMDLEGDLGVDSIKRVEILAAVDERAPALPKVDRARLSALHTLAEIVDLLSAAAPVATATVAVDVVAGTSAPAAPAAVVNPVTAQAAIGRYVVERVPAPANGFAVPGLRSGDRVWIVGDSSIAAALVAELRRRGVNAHATDASPPASANACIHLGGLADVADIAAAINVNRNVFAVARQLAGQLQARPGLFVTVQDTGGAFCSTECDPARAWLGGLPALVKTCALEWPQAAVKAIDLQRGDRDAASLACAIANELFTGGGEVEVGLMADGTRSTLHSTASTAIPAAPVIEAGELVVVSGGARGVTAACLQAWAARHQPTFLLLGRTALHDEPACCAGIADEAGLKRALLDAARAAGQAPTPAELAAQSRDVLAVREIRATLAALREAGSRAHYRAVSVDDADALAMVLEDARDELGPIRGLVHAAGVLADRRIVDKTDAQFDHVFDTKVGGLQALLAATHEDPLQLLCLFSSVSARCGNTGQSDYAMANEVLARVAQAEARRRPGLRVKSLGWGPWDAGMVTPQLKQRFAELGVPMVPLQVGAQMFVDEMHDAGVGAVEIVLGGEPRPEALLSEGSDTRIDALELHVHRDTHGYLAGHAVNGQPVVPVVLVAEWLTRAARSLRPGLHVQALHELKVLKGIRLLGFDGDGDRFRIEARAVPGTQGRALQMSLRDAAGNAHYSARVVLGSTPSAPMQGVPQLQLGDWSGEPLYQDLLFHRGSFELIESVHGISDDGVSASVRGVHDACWPGEAWQLDVAALDGGLQMAVLYGQRMLGGPNLPTSIGELRSYGMPPTSGPISVAAYRRRVGTSATTTDILFSDASGQRLVDLLGVENHALPQA